MFLGSSVTLLGGPAVSGILAFREKEITEIILAATEEVGITPEIDLVVTMGSGALNSWLPRGWTSLMIRRFSCKSRLLVLQAPTHNGCFLSY